MKREASRSVDRPPAKRRGGARPSAAPSKAPSRQDEIASGVIVRFDEAKGYGFIAADDGGEDIFFLRGELPYELSAATRKEHMVDAHVEFELEEKADGKLRAKRMTLLSPPPSGSCPPPGGNDHDRQPAAGVRVVVGRIVRYEREKGYGFIACPGEKKDVFFLPSVCQSPLQERCRSGDNVGDLEVEVEVGDSEEGKPRALRVQLVAPPPMPAQHRRQAPGGVEVHCGVFIRFETQKGFAFLKADDIGEDIFCVRGEFPPTMQGAQHKDQVVGQRVEFELKTMPDGKLRAKGCQLLPAWGPGGPHGGPLGPPPGHRAGRIRKYDRVKGYGFIEVPGPDGDVFFLPSALPREWKEGNMPLEDMEITFDFFVNEEGKARGKDILPARGLGGGGWGPPPMMGMPPQMMGMPPPAPFSMWGPGPPMPPPGPMGQAAGSRDRRDRGERRRGDRDRGDEEVQPLDPEVVDTMSRHLMAEGGGQDYGTFARRFPKVKKRQLEQHFTFTKTRGLDRITIRREDDFLEEEEPIVEEDGIAEEDDVDVRDVPMDEMAIDPSGGCQPQGKIRSYDPAKGYGFVHVEGCDEDIYFPRAALPNSFRMTTKDQMPSLHGCEVSVELGEPGKKQGLRAARIHLLLRWHDGDNCWLLKR